MKFLLSSFQITRFTFQLFSAKVMGDPFLVEEVGLRALRSAADEGQKQGRDFHALLLETFLKLLELLTLRHRLIEMSVESAYLARSVGTGASWKDLGTKYESPGLTVSNPALCSLEQLSRNVLLLSSRPPMSLCRSSGRESPVEPTRSFQSVHVIFA